MKGKKVGKRAKDEGDVLEKMDAFKSKLKGSFLDKEDQDPEAQETAGNAEGGVVTAKIDDDPGMEVDTDTGFLSHKLFFPKGNDEEVGKAERDYEVIDPRQRSARAKEEERERRKRMKPRDGGRGSRR